MLDSLDTAVFTFPWTQTNGTVSLGNVTLVGSNRGWRRPDVVESGKVRNARLHVWRQTSELVEYLSGARNTLRMPRFLQIAGVWDGRC